MPTEKTIFEKIKDQKKWTCYATSFKARRDPVRDRCYPRVGVVYRIVESPQSDAPAEEPIDAKPMYVWRDDGTSEGKVEDAEFPPREQKRLKLWIDQSAPAKHHLHEKYPDKFPPQDEMMKVFVDAFNSVTFREFDTNAMVSSPAVIIHPEIEGGRPVAVSFVATIVPGLRKDALRVTQLWSDGYLGTPPLC